LPDFSANLDARQVSIGSAGKQWPEPHRRAMSELAVALLLAALMTGPSPSGAGGTQAPPAARTTAAPNPVAIATKAETTDRKLTRKGRPGDEARQDIKCPAITPVPDVAE